MKLKDLFEFPETYFYREEGDPYKDTLHNIHKTDVPYKGKIYVPDNTKSHLLGLMLMKGLEQVVPLRLRSVDAPIRLREKCLKAIEIINKHLPGGNVHDVQEELIEAGLKEYARL